MPIVGSQLSSVNQYSSNSVPFNTETTILSYVVPTGHSFYLDKISVWGDYFCEVLIRDNGVQVDGCRIQCTERFKEMDNKEAPLFVRQGHTLTVSIIHDAVGTVMFHSKILGRID